VEQLLVALVTVDGGLAFEAPWAHAERRFTIVTAPVGRAAKEALRNVVMFGSVGTLPTVGCA